MSEFVKDENVFIMLIILIVVFVPIIFLGLMRKLVDFRRELRHLTGEIQRTEGLEKKHWIKKRRKLWLSIFPFIRY